jgi:WD40 repeat protein
MVALAALLIAALACGPLGGGEEEAATEAPTEESAEKPVEVPPTATTMPTKVAPTVEIPVGLAASNIANMQTLRTINASDSVLLAAAASPISHEFATFGYDKVIRIWDGDTGKLLREMTGSGDYGFGLAYAPGGNLLASTGGYHVYIWDPQAGVLKYDVIVNSFAFRVVWSPDGSRLAVVGDGSSKIEIIDAKSGTVLSGETLANPTGRVLWSVAFSPDGSMLATADGDGRLDVLQADTGTIVHQDTQATRGAAWDLEFSPDGSMLASCNAGGGAYIWETADWSVTLSGDDLFSGGCTDGEFSRGSDVYFAVGNDGWLYGWELGEGELLSSISFPKALWTVSLSGDGQMLTVAVDNGMAHILGLP